MSSRLIQVGAYLALLWVVYLAGATSILGSEGVWPNDPTSPIQDIIAAALLHGGGGYHIVANTVALVPLLGALILIDDKPIITIAAVAVLAGALLWFFGEPGIGPHTGASDVVTGLTAFLMVYGVRSGSALSILIAVGVAFFEGVNMLMMSMPGSYGSWEGHLFGVVAGAAWGFLKPRAKA